MSEETNRRYVRQLFNRMTRANAGCFMCSRCHRIDDRIRRLQDMARRLLDQQTLDGIADLVRELEAEKAGLHPQ
jgi:hypothetical protein